MVDATGVEATPEKSLSSAAKTLYAADIYALQYRLHRCIGDITPLLSCATSISDAPSAKGTGSRTALERQARRLGEVLREAKQLSACFLDGEQCEAELASNTVLNASEDGAVDEPLRAYYDQQLQERYTQMQQDIVAADGLLRTWLDSTPGLRGLPVNCVGTAPRQLKIVEADGSAQVCYVYTDTLTPATEQLPAPATYYVGRDPDAFLKTQPSSEPTAPPSVNERPSTENRTTDQKHDAPAVASVRPPPTTAEDRIMEDIQQAIHQMKDGALQMSAMMEQERSQMKSAADLLSGGVAKTQAGVRELDRVSFVVASTRVPWVLSCVPGMPLVWRTVLQPLWALVKQVLLMAAILAMTGCVLVLISAVPKPVLFRGQRTANPTTPSPHAPPTAIPTFNPPRSIPTVSLSPRDNAVLSSVTASDPADTLSSAPTDVDHEDGNSQQRADRDHDALPFHTAPLEVDEDL
ncbi:hypothetical protein ABB37_09509 [Leptomonas pyrrhocoris]|uniref:Uncharacterized protein n=1 Tax=Leptomonas pyrrhocoris TaxID=157538 RepID=A0A0M9FQF5_LEPPY|nr:hypothetical protein ABB37_09509 [Leptomonas pyrrhocoris]XP_015652336.1 hypothetical protein ABB37_09509 [Leptomonas pyrrhocoris]XP_015652337.1 hypothetical protein ABB37_09509 [Leptomonas pyrrhocoris]KPA73896.1 hypothetical protein ABB37_09509 [Leptomonas pyrrhocoris]KPA73897.1 hypothetical protein ABB37_09509 [Leptomonas pyrrhocoris]KPA73898.1 hypothetical protein ABB37_09509 [Leptomonas pyrrhocoris]|eukprot:XP_015652335.1 hypothetical protein ABB37_09509 [Leptomonas pyrrhocoris]